MSKKTKYQIKIDKKQAEKQVELDKREKQLEEQPDSEDTTKEKTTDVIIVLDRAQSGGDTIKVVSDGKIMAINKIHLLPKKDNIVVWDTKTNGTTLSTEEVWKAKEKEIAEEQKKKQEAEATVNKKQEEEKDLCSGCLDKGIKVKMTIIGDKFQCNKCYAWKPIIKSKEDELKQIQERERKLKQEIEKEKK